MLQKYHETGPLKPLLTIYDPISLMQTWQKWPRVAYLNKCKQEYENMRWSFSVNINFSCWMNTEVLACKSFELLLWHFPLSSLTVITSLGTWGYSKWWQYFHIFLTQWGGRACVIPAQSSEAKCGHMGAAITQSDAKASSNSTLCRTTRDEACYGTTAEHINSSESFSKHIILDDCPWLTEIVLVRPMSREMAALNRKSSVKWPVTC